VSEIDGGSDTTIYSELKTHARNKCELSLS